ncbi:NAD(P)/FAD-dependent oxidoreductase [Sellimonas sp.]|uniref:NAD(P)/FAD-dependent oxidoreductase n=1 Tax=Sellimonas sp. TaxID=2021466 RepID=UPI000B3822D2|nr:NAD(P)/FAD-dependent oxidoreductase [Sellimonas sp.]OUP64778.1 aminoacetone oxidase family FAD-binding enzyme [Drancourtella sp. An177]
MGKILVIGGGAAGMMAAVFAARNGQKVCLFEKNEKLGKKLFITGKGRCNLTNACDMEELLDAVVTNRKFLYSSFYGFTNEETMEFFEELGLKMKTERGNRVFPVSDHSSDVIKVLQDELRKLNVKLCLKTEVARVEEKDGHFFGVQLKDGTTVQGDACIIATGGNSYQTTGSTGDGYRFARELGHTVTEIAPALVPLEIRERYGKDLQGLSLRNVEAAVLDGEKELYRDFGEMLFTHYGVSGPLILSASSYIGKRLRERPLKLVIDLKPALSFEQMDARILRDFEENKNRQFKNSLGKLFPSKLILVMISLSGICPDKKVNEISKEERQRFAALIKGFTMTITKTRDFNEAIITQGGVSVKEINPATMESKKVKGVYFAGEVLDLDAVTGGFNLQIAWSTGNAAGSCAADDEI